MFAERLLPGILLAVSMIAQTRKPSQAPPAFRADENNLPVQRIGPDDLLGIVVYDTPELTRTVRVGSDGTIRLPMIRQRIKVAGLVPGDMESSIAEVLKTEQILVDPVVTVTVVEYRSRPVKIVGAVKKPATFQAMPDMTLLDAISNAGGLSEDAGPEILVSKSTTLVQRIPIKRLIDAADPEVNLKLEGGEEIRVPDAGKLFIVGNVKKPGSFSMRDSSESSVLKALALSEGLLPYSGRQAFIYRKEAATGGKNEIAIDLEKIIQRKSPDVALLANDIFYIPDRAGKKSVLAVVEKTMPLTAALGSALAYSRIRANVKANVKEAIIEKIPQPPEQLPRR